MLKKTPTFFNSEQMRNFAEILEISKQGMIFIEFFVQIELFFKLQLIF